MPTPNTPSHGPEPLTDRESEILQLLAQRLSNQEIATELVVSVATVKGYLALLLVLDMIALQLESLRRAATGSPAPDEAAGVLQLHDAVRFIVPEHIRTVIEDETRRQAIREVAGRCADYNKILSSAMRAAEYVKRV